MKAGEEKFMGGLVQALGTLDEADVRAAAYALIACAAEAGIVLTIETRPLEPLAMGHYQMVVVTRPARG